MLFIWRLTYLFKTSSSLRKFMASLDGLKKRKKKCIFKAATVWNERFSWFDSKRSTNQNTTVSHAVLISTWNSMQCVEKRHSAKKDYTMVYAYRPDKHTAHSTFSRGAAGQLSFTWKTGIQHPRWRAHNLLTFAWTSQRTLNKKGSGCLIFFSSPSIPPSNQHQEST